ncbi:hypothetical protein GO013_01875 [Pseudodesulfovibrio sp. JC047]|uniref:alpha/beta hydrolase family protein n=1 Tax=Pseudodesulfovibrio sp. JC047 TaxID=2683199 RepID=UPI0013D4C11A|nr:hypothetical protein [Pseudodesulfovibrio sp. JC047]NDV18167.1 hypothetical protein [Pseudodesulfovibrio sp. JC047]
MRHALSWFLSLLFHAILVVTLVQSVELEPLLPEDILEVDLTEIAEPQPIIPMPQPQAIPEPDPTAELAAPEEPAIPAPLPMNKTVVLADEMPPPPEPTPAPEPEPDVVEISPNKTLEPEPELADDGKPKKIVIRKDFTVHRGHEARFGRAMMGDYFSYSTKEFSGQFRTKDNRVVSIIDARNTKYGRFLIYDSKNKTLRRLKQAFGKYVYTIGPSVYADEPVIGSVTFLAKNDRIERFILMTDDDRIAHYPRKVHVREEDVAFPSSSGTIQANLSLPPYGQGHEGVLVIHGPNCVNPGLIQGFTRALSMHDMATLYSIPRGCFDDGATSGSMEDLIADARTAFTYFAKRKEIDAHHVGIWGNGPGVPASIRIAHQTNPAFLVCVLTDSVSIKDMPNRDTLAALDMPILWLFTGRKTARWTPLIRTLETCRDSNKQPFTIIVAPLKASQDVLDAQGDNSGWVEQIADDHAALATSWIHSLKKAPSSQF